MILNIFISSIIINHDFTSLFINIFIFLIYIICINSYIICILYIYYMTITFLQIYHFNKKKILIYNDGVIIKLR